MGTRNGRFVARVALATAVSALLTSGGSIPTWAADPSPGEGSPAPMGSPGSMGSPPGSAAVLVGDLVIEGAWARTSPMVERAGAAYVLVKNQGAVDDALVGGTTPAAGTVELHETREVEGGMMAMARVATIPVPAGGEAVLEPGGLHIMLIDLAAPLVEGTTLEVELAFESGARVVVPFEVRAGMPMASPAMPMPSPDAPMHSPAAGSPAPMASPEG